MADWVWKSDDNAAGYRRLRHYSVNVRLLQEYKNLLMLRLGVFTNSSD